ncbi:CAP domain-containing protein [Dethiobacter alkaliphilus]|uniref:SCP-like extracellular n=1 Tax=Dethiobacter alkaliphilus AHT 1 TaxID=555088 RepID=C0GHX9_DETAL|nr:CAP domain-containing protein [Dethiobacter alkaliphilus]EEG77053.1 SCP-like extracellular [Dethiobacter alkaliphilus AHT 1]
MKKQRGFSIFVLLAMLIFLSGCPGIPWPQTMSEEDTVTGDPEPADPIEDVPAGSDSERVPSEAGGGQISLYHDITAENVEKMNEERYINGQSPLVLNEELSQVANWVAQRYLAAEGEVTTGEIQQKLEPYPQLAATTFTLNQVSATGANNQRFVEWFAQKTTDDITESENVRNNLLNARMRKVGVACVGKTVVEEGTEQYKMVFVWLFMPESPPAGTVFSEGIAKENIALLNTEREGQGLGVLQPHAELDALAQLKAKDILQNLPYNELAHDSAELGTPHEMITAHISPVPASTAENLWTQYGSFHADFMTDIAQKAHSGLMNSPGHRKNMMEPAFTHIGVGVAAAVVDGEDGKLYKVVLVQLFIKE